MFPALHCYISPWPAGEPLARLKEEIKRKNFIKAVVIYLTLSFLPILSSKDIWGYCNSLIHGKSWNVKGSMLKVVQKYVYLLIYLVRQGYFWVKCRTYMKAFVFKRFHINEDVYFKNFDQNVPGNLVCSICINVLPSLYKKQEQTQLVSSKYCVCLFYIYFLVILQAKKDFNLLLLSFYLGTTNICMYLQIIEYSWKGIGETYNL